MRLGLPQRQRSVQPSKRLFRHPTISSIDAPAGFRALGTDLIAIRQRPTHSSVTRSCPHGRRRSNERYRPSQSRIRKTSHRLGFRHIRTRTSHDIIPNILHHTWVVPHASSHLLRLNPLCLCSLYVVHILLVPEFLVVRDRCVGFAVGV